VKLSKHNKARFFYFKKKDVITQRTKSRIALHFCLGLLLSASPKCSNKNHAKFIIFYLTGELKKNRQAVAGFLSS
jgi:hypothetical protein